MASRRRNKRLVRWGGAIGLAAALLVPTSRGCADNALRAQLETLRQADLEVAQTGYRLATAAAPLCAGRGRAIGLVLADPAQFSPQARPDAIALYHLDDGPAVTAVVPGSSAALAGVRQGDALMAVNGRNVAVPPVASAKASPAMFQSLLDIVDSAAVAGPVVLSLRRNGAPISIRLQGVAACPTDFQLTLDKKMDAEADGKTVAVTAGMVEMMRSEDELAFVLAHELSHNILGHRQKIKAHQVGVKRSETEADFYGVHLLGMAGYDPMAAATLMARAAKAHGLLWITTDHMNDRDRVIFLEDVARTVAADKAAGRSILPDLSQLPRGD